MSALPIGQSRRLARSGALVRVATGMVFGRAARSTLPSTPHTPHQGKPARMGASRKEGGAADRFWLKEPTGIFQKPVDGVVTNLQSPVVVRVPPPRIAVTHPRVVPFLPRIWSFHPRATFLNFAAFLLSLSLFSLEKERERGAKTQKWLIHGFLKIRISGPRISYEVDSNSVDEKPCFWQTRGQKRAPVGVFVNPWIENIEKNLYESMAY